jgi:type III secretion system low calcium response chaperone LcrH/SycD
MTQKEEITPLSDEALNVLYAMAYALYEKGRYQEAKHFFHLLTLSNAHERKYWMGLAASCQMLKEYAKALEFYGVAAIQDPVDPYVHLHAAGCCFANGQNDRGVSAIEAAEKVATLSNKHERLLGQLKMMRQAWSSNKSKENAHG